MSVIDNFEKMQNTSVHQDLFSSKGRKSQNDNESVGYQSDANTKKSNLIQGRFQRKHKTEARKQETDKDCDSDEEMSHDISSDAPFDQSLPI